MASCWELAASCCGFLGGLFLTLDVLAAKKRIYQETGKEEARAAAQDAGADFGDRAGNLIFVIEGVRLWYAERSLLWNRIGFGLVAFGFLIDVMVKLKEILQKGCC